MVTKAKKLMKTRDMVVPYFRGFRELRSENILDAILPNDNISTYLPDKGAREYQLDERFIQGIVNILETEYFQAIASLCHNARVIKSEAVDCTRELVTEKENAEELISKPFKSSKFLIKKPSAQSRSHRAQKKY